jgi:phage baseplate assembly protein W
MSKRRLFVGFSTHDANTNTKLYDIELVNRDLLNHFQTRLGERVMLPNYGTIIWNLLFEPLTEGNRNRIISDATRIIKSDTRVELVSINVIEMDHGLKVDMQLKYNPYGVLQNFSASYDRRMANRS